jgi:hypothetical protein
MEWCLRRRDEVEGEVRKKKPRLVSEAALIEARKVVEKRAAYFRALRDAPAGTSERMPPMISVPDARPRSRTSRQLH